MSSQGQYDNQNGLQHGVSGLPVSGVESNNRAPDTLARDHYTRRRTGGRSNRRSSSVSSQSSLSSGRSASLLSRSSGTSRLRRISEDKMTRTSSKQTRRSRSQERRNNTSRRSRRSLMSSSSASVVSSSTNKTSSSSGSNTTVTQDSYEQSKTLPHPASGENTTAAPGEPSGTEKSEDISPNVFQYMEREHGNGSDWESSGSESSNEEESEDNADSHSTPMTSPEVKHTTMDRSFSNEQLHSDSGISMRGSSPEAVQRSALRPKRAVKFLSEQSCSKKSGPRPTAQKVRSPSAPTYTFPGRDDVFSDFRGGPHSPTSTALTHYSTMKHHSWSPQYSDPANEAKSDCERELAGYELLSTKLSAWGEGSSEDSKCLIPVYRRFESLHHRVLLHMQDEISELEEQLRQIDDYIANTSRKSDGAFRPASRREESRYGGDVHFQRTDLLGRICMKITSYDKALAAYKSSVNGSESATERDINAYQDWMRDNEPVIEAERGFLNSRSDLMRVAGKKASQPVSEDSEDTLGRFAFTGPPAIFLFTLIAIYAVPGLLARLIILSIIAGGGYAALHFLGMDFTKPSREVAACMAVCMGVMATVAGTLS